MASMTTTATAAVLACSTAGLLIVGPGLHAQGGNRSAIAAALFDGLDGNKDGALSRDEARAGAEQWFTAWKPADATGLTSESVIFGLSGVLPSAGPQCGGRSANPRTPCPGDVDAMVAALPAAAPAKPKAPRKVLVIARAAGYAHSSIPLAARTVEELGKKTGAWATTITYDAADVTEQNLKSYDAIFLASTTGHFLDDPTDAAATAARRKALLDFVRGGKGLAAIHAASDSYHASAKELKAAGPGQTTFASRLANLGPGLDAAVPVGTRMVTDGDANSDKMLSREEITALVATWFDKADTQKIGRVTQADFVKAYDTLMPPPPPATPRAPRVGNGQAKATDLGPDDQVGTWPEFNTLLGGFFKFHWNDGQSITYKIDDPRSPLTAPFKGKTPFVVADETYTFGREVYSRKNLRVLTSVDMAAMSAEDKAKEQFPRPDGDTALSWIRAEQKGRVFYMSHGHNEKVYANPVLLQHLLAGIQFVIGDLPADSSPSSK
ncbi:Cytochrome c551/c552 [Luteitalea pratensis]|uniref:Cytochrome c551/c552 n=1 Tax=Luteitalea pratensis TaxID=1855912 RepID=A0A143PH12_LUTPR|nr:ThuA domain-containing protein [Luteitalea pratensis]AMY07872.1 Cytochrome c551/c552 [Luteitalea pratensis]